MNWNDPDYRAWCCEQIGVEYKGLPLSHQHKQRFLSLSLKKNLTYPGPPKKRNIIMNLTNKNDSSVVTETTLLNQYDQELATLNDREAKYKMYLKDVKDQRATITKKRNALARIVLPAVAPEKTNGV